MSDQKMSTPNEQADYPLKEVVTLVGTIVLFICSIFALIVFIGGVLMPLWLQVVWDLANLVFTIIALIRTYLLAQDLERRGSDEEWTYALGGFLILGGLVGIIGSFFSENFIAAHSLLLFVILAIWSAFDLRS